MEDLANTTELCRYCLMCRHVAPVGVVTQRETLTPHGMALIVESQKRGLINWDEDTVGAMFSEVDGGNSRMHCVNHIPFEDAIAAIRAQLVSENLAPQAVYDVQKKLETWGNPYQEISAVDLDADDQTGIGLYISDDFLCLRENDIQAVMKLLDALNIQTAMFGGYSNGFLASSLGLIDLATSQATHLIDQIKTAQLKQVIVLSPGDYYTFTQVYSERLGIDFPDDVAVIELNTLLAKALNDNDLSLYKIKNHDNYAYVDPTHAVRVPQRHEIPRKLLSSIVEGDLYELLWRKDNAHPVGSTGIQFTHPDIGEKLTRARLADAQSKGIQTIVTEDAGTLYHLSQYNDDYDIQVVSLYQLLSDHLDDSTRNIGNK